MAASSIVDGKMKNGSSLSAPQQPTSLLEEMKLLKEMQDHSGSRRCINSELWHACAGPLVSLPQLGSLVYYFPQGHSEQVAVSTKRPATSQIPNYPNLPSQLMCQVHNVTLHADKETDEIFAQMSLQPVNTEKDMFPVPDFGLKPSKHPSEFFCKTLTASDTSTHGGFSVPRRAAEKLFPPLDFTMQPPTQELVVRDLHDNTWTFRHIYRGQPKRHLLTTGWSLFVGAKRLKAGDSVLFIRDEKSQLLVGIRRANRQQTTLPSSVLSADSMHIGILAAAAHANANRSSFTIFYNPRACPSEFVIPLAKYRKAVCGTRISVGMRFGMMFETEESGKRRYMGTITGVSDLDPIRWPGSKWRNLQVEWDEPGCVDKQNRVSSWEVETPESLFIFPSLTSGLKRPFFAPETEWGNLIKRPLISIPENGSGNLLPYSYQNLCSDQLIQMMMKPQMISTRDIEPKVVNPVQAPVPSLVQKDDSDQSSSEVNVLEKVQSPTRTEKQVPVVPELEKSKSGSSDRAHSGSNHPNQSVVLSSNHPNQSVVLSSNHPNQSVVLNSNHPNQSVVLSSNQAWPPQQPKPEPHSFQPQPSDSLSPFNNGDDWVLNPSPTGFHRPQGPVSMFGVQDPSGTFMDPMSSILPQMGQDMWDHSRYLSQIDQLTPLPDHDPSGFLRDLSDESNTQSGIYGSLVDPIIDDLCGMKETRFQNPPECIFSSSQDVQSQITSASLADTQTLSRHEFPDSSGGTSSSNVDFGDSSLLRSSSWQPVAQPLRTYTKVQKAGSVGRSIDVTNFKKYSELLSAIESMFGLEGLLSDSRGSGWKLVYVDYENDVLLVGDDPWEEFVGCVRCIRILSPVEVQQMSEEGMKLLNSTAAAGQGISSS